MVRLVDAIEDLDDVQNVYTNADISDEIAEQLDTTEYVRGKPSGADRLASSERLLGRTEPGTRICGAAVHSMACERRTPAVAIMGRPGSRLCQ